jgi:hypothetical protein
VALAEAYLAATTWTFAKTLPDNPHEYVVMPKEPGPNLTGWKALANLIVEHGRYRKWHGRRYRTVSLAGWDLWVMSTRPILVNRKPTGHAGWDDERPAAEEEQAPQPVPAEQPTLWLHESDCWGWDPDGRESAS